MYCCWLLLMKMWNNNQPTTWLLTQQNEVQKTCA
jgi:hypothetical protein